MEQESRKSGAAYWPITDRISEPVSFDLTPLRSRENTCNLVPVAESAGYTAAEMIIPYPPGIPVLYPGEIISRALAAELTRLADLGRRFHGHDVSGLRTIPVRP
ncbi:hypothetical protein LJK87_39695 [Paenibacillus sp. P25]|nr:hypothetical protein LJK87_39695 [Paenibacillus sp. P25]